MQNEKPKTKPKNTDEQMRLLTVKQVAELDGTSEKTVRRAIDAGLLPILRVGPARRAIRIHPNDHAIYRRGQFGHQSPYKYQ
jgi:excisionase family DNA binding protein